MRVDDGLTITHWEKMPDSVKSAIEKMRRAEDRTSYIIIERQHIDIVDVTFTIDGIEMNVQFDIAEHPEIQELKTKCEQIALDKMDKVNWQNRPYLDNCRVDVDKAWLPEDLKDG